MIQRQFLYMTAVVLWAGSASAITSCLILTEDQHNTCNYTVTCEYYAGSAVPLHCKGDPYVTFIMTKSNMTVLTYGFFGSTNFDSRVRVFKARNNSWDGIEALTFKFYPKTQHIDVSGNGIKFINNEAFKFLTGLDTLNISHNRISTLNPKAFLINDYRGIDLQVLDLSFNTIKELRGELFSYIPRLKILYLNNNMIATIGEECLSITRDMTNLYLQHNRINALNMTLINLKSLKELDVSFNSLTKLVDYEISRLVELEIFNVSNNNIVSIDIHSFKQSPNLQSLDLKYNNINSTIDNNLFVNNKNLKYLDLSHNHIIHLQDNVFKNHSLNYINLEGNKLQGPITNTTLSGFGNIETMNLFNQSITDIKNNAFTNLDKLTYLNLSHNIIADVEISGFENQNTINVLDMSWNALSSIYFLQNCLANLTELFLNNNNLTIILKNAFDEQSQLQKLDISYNKITVIDENALPLYNLQYLDILNNPVTGVLKENVVSHANYLRYLDLSNFKLNKIDANAITDLPRVARLNISHNEIEFIHTNNFKNMSNVYSFDVSYNKLSALDLDNVSLSTLQAIYLNNNKFSTISESLLNINSLLHVDLSYNELKDLSGSDFTQWTNLNTLYLSHNQITNFGDSISSHLSKLVVLDLSSNLITEINLSYSKSIVFVDLSINKLNKLNYTLFNNLDKLESLNLSYNYILELNPGSFKNVQILKILDLSHNHVPELRFGTFKGLNRTEVLDLSGNDISSIDVNVFHDCFELKKLILDYNLLKTLDVEGLILAVPKLTSLSLGGNRISCSEIVLNVRKINSSTSRVVEVTSIDKVYHEDNVHGIMCGDVVRTTQKPKVEPSGEASSSTGLIIGCIIAVLSLLVAAGVGFYFYKRKTGLGYSHRETVTQSPSSLDLNGSDFQVDLLAN